MDFFLAVGSMIGELPHIRDMYLLHRYLQVFAVLRCYRLVNLFPRVLDLLVRCHTLIKYNSTDIHIVECYWRWSRNHQLDFLYLLGSFVTLSHIHAIVWRRFQYDHHCVRSRNAIRFLLSSILGSFPGTIICASV